MAKVDDSNEQLPFDWTITDDASQLYLPPTRECWHIIKETTEYEPNTNGMNTLHISLLLSPMEMTIPRIFTSYRIDLRKTNATSTLKVGSSQKEIFYARYVKTNVKLSTWNLKKSVSNSLKALRQKR